MIQMQFLPWEWKYNMETIKTVLRKSIFLFGGNYGYNLRLKFDKFIPVTKFVPQGVQEILGASVR